MTGSTSWVSIFGVGWAPRHEAAAGELVRVLKPGGTLGLCHWTASGNVGRSLQVVPRHLPPSPNASRAWLWGDEQFLEQLFTDSDIDFVFERASATWEFGSLEEMLAYLVTKSGPLVMAKRYLQSQGRWAEARAEMETLGRGANVATDGTWRARAGVPARRRTGVARPPGATAARNPRIAQSAVHVNSPVVHGGADYQLRCRRSGVREPVTA